MSIRDQARIEGRLIRKLTIISNMPAEEAVMDPEYYDDSVDGCLILVIIIIVIVAAAILPNIIGAA